MCGFANVAVVRKQIVLLLVRSFVPWLAGWLSGLSWKDFVVECVLSAWEEVLVRLNRSLCLYSSRPARYTYIVAAVDAVPKLIIHRPFISKKSHQHRTKNSRTLNITNETCLGFEFGGGFDLDYSLRRGRNNNCTRNG